MKILGVGVCTVNCKNAENMRYLKNEDRAHRYSRKKSCMAATENHTWASTKPPEDS